MKKLYLISFLTGIFLTGSILSAKAQDSEKPATKKILLENFSTEPCGNCPRGHKVLEEILGEKDNIVWVTHHAGYEPDPYTIEDSKAYTWLYGTTTYAPAIMMDRTRFIANNTYVGPVTDITQELVTEMVTKAEAVPAPVSVRIFGQYDEETRMLQVQVIGDMNVDEFPGGTDIRLNIFLTEDGIKTTRQVNSPEKVYIHNHVMRQAMTETWGTKVKFVNRYYKSYKFTTKLEATWNPENMHVIAFFSNYNSKNYNKCTVYNTEVTQLTNMEPNAIETVTADIQPEIVVSDGKLFVVGQECNSIQLYDLTGKVVRTANRTSTLAIEDLADGIYLVKIADDKYEQVKKVLLSK